MVMVISLYIGIIMIPLLYSAHRHLMELGLIISSRRGKAIWPIPLQLSQRCQPMMLVFSGVVRLCMIFMHFTRLLQQKMGKMMVL